MNRFFWLIRREVWEHKAIWIAPSVVIRTRPRSQVPERSWP